MEPYNIPGLHSLSPSILEFTIPLRVVTPSTVQWYQRTEVGELVTLIATGVAAMKHF